MLEEKHRNLKLLPEQSAEKHSPEKIMKNSFELTFDDDKKDRANRTTKNI